MNHKLIIALLLLTTQAYAGGYEEAIDTAKDAAMKQSGLENGIEKARDYATKEAVKFIGKDYENGVVALSYLGKALYQKKVVIKYKVIELDAKPDFVKLTFTWRF